MSILASLARAYDRLPDAPPFGFSSEKIGFLISLNADGRMVSVSDLRTGEGKKKIAPTMLVPQPVKRTAGIAPNFLWDKTSYVLGVTAGEGKRTADEHAAFIQRHETDLANTEDAGLRALLLFLKNWTADQFMAPDWPEEMKDQNVVFALEDERLRNVRLHDRPAAKELWGRLSAAGDRDARICLVTGEPGPVARLHPSIKGVWGAQSSGAALVSFNLDSFTSFGHEQGNNAPVSELAAAKYTTALNRFLERDSGHRIQIGDASTVFWADASEANSDAAELAESVFGGMLDTVDERMQSSKVGDVLAKIREGRPVASFDPDLAEGVRFHVLGLAPNAARLAIRFYFEDSFGVLTENYRKFVSDMRVMPEPKEGYPPLWRYLLETAVLGKRENIAPNLAGEWMRAILNGTNYPLTLMSSVLTRIRADGEVNALRVGILKAVLVRNFKMEAPVAFDPDNKNKGYVLGRLFATYEQIQSAALGLKLNSSIKDKFYGSASAQPRKVFPMLESGSANHLSKIGKQAPGWRVNLEKQISEIMAIMSPADDPFPASLSSADQALFVLGYHHQRNEFFKSKKSEASGETAE